MALKSWTRDYAPIFATLAVVASVLFPNKYSREVASLRADLETYHQDNETLRAQFASVLTFIHDYDFKPIVAECLSETGGGGVARKRDIPRPPVSSDFSYMRVGNRDGFRVGKEYWLVGQMSPWGLIESAFQGGFVADGLVYSRYSRRGVHDDD